MISLCALFSLICGIIVVCLLGWLVGSKLKRLVFYHTAGHRVPVFCGHCYKDVFVSRKRIRTWFDEVYESGLMRFRCPVCHKREQKVYSEFEQTRLMKYNVWPRTLTPDKFHKGLVVPYLQIRNARAKIRDAHRVMPVRKPLS